jgi:Fe-S cluster assembly protein SufD
MSAVAHSAPSPALARMRDAWVARPRPIPRLEDVQRRALDHVLERGLPGPREELWKYSSLRRFGTRHFSLPAPVSELPAGDAARWLPAARWHRLVLVNGRFHAGLSTPLPAGHGVRVSTLREAALREPVRAAAWLEQDAHEGATVFAALNAAFVEDGIVLELGEGAALAEPLYVLHLTTQAQGALMTHARVVIEAGPGAQAIVVEHHLSAGDSESYTNCVTSGALGRAARLEHYRLQEEDRSNFHFSRFEARLAEDAELVDHRIALGTGFDRSDIEVRLEAEGARATLLGLFVVDLAGHVDTHTRIDHLAPRTTSAEDYRGIAGGRGRGIFNGKVVVHAGAQHTVARQTNKNLLLSRDAEIDTKPELEIYADDVKCSHGATTGQLDALALFYLRSRGLAEREARAALTRAFAASVVERFGLEPLRQHLESTLPARLDREEDVT